MSKERTIAAPDLIAAVAQAPAAEGTPAATAATIPAAPAFPRGLNPVVVEVPARCPRCGGFKRDVRRTTPFPTRAMRLPDGRTHIGMRLQNCQCMTCRCAFNVKVPMA